jgi:hypothetical protein
MAESQNFQGRKNRGGNLKKPKNSIELSLKNLSVFYDDIASSGT